MSTLRTGARRVTPALAVLGVAVALPAATTAAPAVQKPGVSTGIPGGVTPQSAVLTGKVAPRGASTTYRFDVGIPGKGYTIHTPSTPAQPAEGTSVAAASATVTGLSSATKYRYRLVAHNRKGTTVGASRVLTTPVQPLGFTVAAGPTSIGVGEATTISGTLGGTNGGSHQVVLQQQPFPFTGPFENVGNPAVTNATGGFAFPVLGVGISTRYRVITPGKTLVSSAVVGVSVESDIESGVRHHLVSRGSKLEFSGKAHPASEGVPVRIVKKDSKGRFRTVAETKTGDGGKTFTRWSAKVKIRSSGYYRAELRYTDGSYEPSHGGTIHIRTR